MKAISRRKMLWCAVTAMTACSSEAVSAEQGAGTRVPVYVSASFTDRNGLFIEDLDKEEVRIVENGEARTIEFMAKDEIPVVYGLLFEEALLATDSGSRRMGERSIPISSFARDIAYQMIDKPMAREAVWIGTYAREMKVGQEATTDGFLAKAAIQRLQGARETRDPFFYGALYASIRKMAQCSERRRVLIFFLEFVDAESSGKLREMGNLLRASNVELFAISFATTLGTRPGALLSSMSGPMLRDLAELTAGRAFMRTEFAEHPEDLIRRISNQIRTLYTFGFATTSSADKPGSLAIECRRPGSRVMHRRAVPILN